MQDLDAHKGSPKCIERIQDIRAQIKSLKEENEKLKSINNYRAECTF